ncbi:MAG: prepilin-type N-terminal cleavage/methylation domain-containing protein [Verrucomicrobiota bacterium]
MKLPSPQLSRTYPAAFSLIELLSVIGVLSILLALAAPALMPSAPSRKAAAHELAAAMDRARAEAIALQRDLYIAFPDETHPGTRRPFRTMAFFLATEPSGEPIIDQPVRQIRSWFELPEGLVFLPASVLASATQSLPPTVIDLPQRRDFIVRDGQGNALEITAPFICMSPSGRILHPPFHQAEALHLTLGGGHYDPASQELVPTTGSSATVAGETLRFSPTTGSVQILTD